MIITGVFSRLIIHMIFAFRWFFDILEYPRNKVIVVLNGLAMLLTFLIFRMVAMPIFWYQIWLVSGTEEVQILGHIQAIMYVPTFVLDVLNILWFYKICRGFVKAVLNMSNSKHNGLKLKSVWDEVWNVFHLLRDLRRNETVLFLIQSIKHNIDFLFKFITT